MSHPTQRPVPALEPELEALANRIEDAVREAVASVHDLGEAFLAAQVGMARPSLVLAVQQGLTGGIDEAGRRFAETVELIHDASLLHELGADAPDQDDALWTPKKAILLGDLLLARAMTLLAASGSPDAVAQVARITGGLAEGQILANSPLSETPSTEDLAHARLQRREQVLRLRYGRFFGCAATLGALAAGAHEAARDAAGALGVDLGVAYGLAKTLEEGEDLESLPGGPAVLEGRLRDHGRGARAGLISLGAAAPGADLAWLEGWVDTFDDWLAARPAPAAAPPDATGTEAQA